MHRIFLCAILTAVFGAPVELHAQALPDTSLKNPLPDSLIERRRAEPRGVTVVSGGTLSPRQVSFLKNDTVPQPKRAAFYSAILPGAGQLYNRQYWKVPVIYAGIAVSTYFLIDNSSKYRDYRKAYLARVDGDPFTRDKYEKTYQQAGDLQLLQDTYKRYLDLTTLLTAVGYTLQVLDALTFAHLNGFDVSRNISMRVQPVLQPQFAGVGLVMRW